MKQNCFDKVVHVHVICHVQYGMTTEKMMMLCMFYGSVPIFIGWGEGLRVEQRGPVRGVKKPSVKVF